MVSSHQPTRQNFFGVSKSIFSQVSHSLPGHAGEGEENVCLCWNQKQHSCLSLLWLFPQAGWVMHIPLMFICLQNTPELTVLCEKQLSLHTVQARCNYSINGSTNRSNISKFRKSCHCSWPPFLIHSIESSGRRCSWWRHGDKDNITLVCLGFLGLTSACCAWMNFR